ncbi:MAG: alpha/beta fold hydrolase [Candidatus Hydrogenedentes bacterium]|nr:alpha/beta fold hydrolase [Candidatus Hydrogenedentota bacterium]
MFRLCTSLALLGAALACAESAPAWPGFDWNDWQALTGVERPDIESPQAGLPDLLPLLKNDPADAREFPSLVVWKRKRDLIRHRVSTLIGTGTGLRFDAADPEIIGEEILPEYKRFHMRLPGLLDEPIPAYLLIPHTLVSRPAPAMIVLHQTQAPGKREAVGLEGDPEMAFADELAKRGYICLAPDAKGFGERIPEGGQPYDGAMDFYRAHPEWSFFGQMNIELVRMAQFLAARGDVDESRIGVIGHSHGAYGGIVGAALNTDISLVVASCGFTTLRTDPRPDRWSHLTPLLPRLGFYVDDIKQAPLDWHEVAAMIAPRAFYNYATLDDDIFPETDNLAEVYADLEKLYRLHGVEDKFHGELAPGKHQFPKAAREAAYAWIDRQFKVERAAGGAAAP